MTENSLVIFENYKIRRHFDEQTESWYFSVVDIVSALTSSANPRDYWFKMKIRVKSEDGLELSTICRQLKIEVPIRKEGSESVTKCNRLKMEAAEGKKT